MSSGLVTIPHQTHGALAPKSLMVACCMYFRSPFFIAVEEGDVPGVVSFLREDAMWLKMADKKERRTAWHIAAANGHVKVLEVLVARTRDDDVGLLWNTSPSLSSRIRVAVTGRDTAGPDERVSELLNGRASLGVTPLVLAAERDHVEAVKYLLSLGADPWQGDNEGRNPAHYAAKTGAIKALQVLFEEEKPLTSRASNRNRPGTRYVDSLDTFGFTPLHYATWANRKSAMMLLIGFDANIITRSLLLHNNYYNLPAGSTPLHIACLLGDLERVKLLLRAYYETAADLLPSQTALLGTVERRRRARNHPDPRLILTRTQRLPFHIAARAGHRHLLDWLDPSVPLMFLFGGEEETTAAPDGRGGMVALVGVSRLTVIAAKALHKALLASIDAAAEDIRRYEEAMESQRRRREERRLARETEAAAKSLKQGKEPPPDSGIRGRIRRLIERASRDGGGGMSGGTGTTRSAVPACDRNGMTGGGEAPTTGWRPWRSRTRRRRRKMISSGTGDGVTAVVSASASASANGLDGSQAHGTAAPRSPWRRRRRSALNLARRIASAVNFGGGRAAGTAAAAAQVSTGTVAPAAAAAGRPTSGASVRSSNIIIGRSSEGGGGLEQAQQQNSQPLRISSGNGGGGLNSSLRLRIFRSIGSQRSQRSLQLQQQQQQQQSLPPGQWPSIPGQEVIGFTGADAVDGPEAPAVGTAMAGSGPLEIPVTSTADGIGGGVSSSSGSGVGGLAASLTRTVQRLYRGSLRRQSSGTESSDPAALQLNERLNRAGITIPLGPDEAVAYFTPGREPRYNMPTQILFPASGAFNTSLREIAASTTTAAEARTISPRASSQSSQTSESDAVVTNQVIASYTPLEAVASSPTDIPSAAEGPLEVEECTGEFRVEKALSAGEGNDRTANGDGAGSKVAAKCGGDKFEAAKVSATKELEVGAGAAADVAAPAVAAAFRDGDAAEIPSSEVAAKTGTTVETAVMRVNEGQCSLDSKSDTWSQPWAAAAEDTRRSLDLVPGWHQDAPQVVWDAGLVSEQVADPSPASPAHSIAYLPPIRSAGTSRVPSRRTLLHLPGTADMTESSGTTAAAADNSSGAAHVSGTSSSRAQLLEGLARLEGREHSSRAGEDAEPDNSTTMAETEVEVEPEGGDNTPNTEAAWRRSAGIGRMGAGARQLFHTLRNTLRSMSNQNPAQVVPVAQNSPRPSQSPSSSPSRARRRNHRNRTPDSSMRRGRSQAPSSVVVAEPPSGAAGAGAGDVDVDADGELLRSPNASHHRGCANPNPHSHSLAARGVRVASGRLHARLSLYGRLNGGAHSEGATSRRGVSVSGGGGSGGGGGGGGAVSRWRLLSRRSSLPSRLTVSHDGTEKVQSTTEADGEAEVVAGAPGAPRAAGSDGRDGSATAAPATMVESAASLPLVNREHSSSFSSTSSREGPSGGVGTAAAGADNDDEDVCPVCLDEAPNLLVQTCCHQICMDCARDLIKRHSLTPALCPYCRGIISGFKARVVVVAAAAVAAAAGSTEKPGKRS